jgi:signal transduction histidine kinase/DNA-binding response OmpR family regulator/ligand-binding sensor domain-containing protein
LSNELFLRLSHLIAAFFSIFLPFEQISAQDYTVNVQTYDIEDGLLHRDVQTVFEDKNGFIWIGGTKGLQRFDGHDFKTWTKADKSGLIYYISCIGQDDEGWLWLWNNDLLCFVFLNPESEEILTVKERFGDDSLIDFKQLRQSQPRIPTNSKGQLLFGTNAGNIISYDSQNGFQVHPLEQKMSISVELVDKQDDIWVQSKEQGLFKINIKGELLISYRLPTDMQTGSYSIVKESIYFIETKRNFDSVRPMGKLMKIDATGQAQFLRNSISPWFFIDNYFWSFESEVGWKIYDATQTEVLQMLKKEDFSPALSNGYFIPYPDSRGNVWIHGNLGLNKIRFQKSRFQNYFAYDKETDKPFANAVRGILVDKDTIFANLEQSVTVRINRNNSEAWQILSKKQSARPIEKKDNGDLLIGYPFQLQTMTTKGEITRKVAVKDEIISGIWSMYQADNRKLWIGSGDKLVFVDENKDYFQPYQSVGDPFGFETRRGAIQNMIPNENGLVWFCSWTGLYLFDTKTEKILARYASDEKGEFYLPADLFYYLFKDKDGIYWLGTNEGLIRWERDGNPQPTTRNSQLFTRQNGLSNNVIYAIFEDDYNRLWLSSDYGIMSFDKTTFQVKNYLEKDGISHHEFNRTSQFKTADGTIYFGGLNGITAFHPDDFVGKERDYAKMLISDFDIFAGKEQQLVNRVGELRSTKIIDFYPNDRFFRLKFVLPTFEDNSHKLYAWKIEGVDTDWNYQKENSLQIGVLPYGQHFLKIKGQSSEGGWSPHELEITVNVLKPFYLQMWFIVLAIFALIFVAYWFYKRRTRLLKQTQKLLEKEIKKATAQIENDKKTIEIQAAELRQIDKVKTRFFANVSHELRTPITLIQGPIQSAINSQQLNNQNFTLLYKAKQNTKKLLQLVNEILDLTKLDAHKLELEETTVVFYIFLKRIISNFESYAANKSIDLIFQYAPLQRTQVKLDTNKFEKIVSNLLTNAFKFTPDKGHITVSVEDFGKDLKIMVQDTGRGISQKDLPQIFNRFYQSSTNTKAEGGLGIGLALSMEYVKLMDGKMWAESSLEGVNQGSIFYVQLPRKEVIAMLSNEDALALTQPNKSEIVPTLKPEKTTETPPEHTILLVEDNPDLQEYISFLLSPYYQVLTAENGKVALELLKSLPSLKRKLPGEKPATRSPSLIISDIMMPIMDGYEFLEKLKNQDRFRHIPVIMLTARAELKDRLKALQIGVDDYLLKPFEEEELLTRIENLLQNYQERLDQRADTSKESAPSNSSDISNKKEADEAESQQVSATLTVTKEDQDWLQNLEAFLSQNLSNHQYSVPQLAFDMTISERQLRRRIKQLTGLSSLHYIKEIRLQKARQLLEEKTYKTLTQTATATGFPNSKTFSRNFFQRFGKTPSDYLND